MPKVWNSVTPYQDKVCESPEELVALLSLRQGFKDAMNSAEVKAIYVALKDLLYFLDDDYTVPSPTLREQMGIPQALAAYEAGLKEQDHA